MFRHTCRSEGNAQIELKTIARRPGTNVPDLAQPEFQCVHGFRQGRGGQRRLACRQIAPGRLLEHFRRRIVARQIQRLAVQSALHHARELGMDLFPLASQKALVSRILNERVLEHVPGSFRAAAAKEKPRLHELLERLVQRVGPLRHDRFQ